MGDVVVVTGAGSGLGRAVSRMLAESGRTVAALDLVIDAARATCESVGRDAAAFEVDVSDESSVAAAVAAVADRLGTPSALVNAAAVQQFGHSHTFDFAVWSRIVGVNLSGTFLMCRAVLPHLLASGGGSIVNIASTAALSGIPYDAAYCAAKGGVVQLTRSLAIEYSERNIRVNAVAPGGMQTPMLHVPLPDDASPALLGRIRRSMLGVAEPDDVANMVRFLLSEEAARITGATMVVDGGALA
jgi:NAD(P)-dependent dehydrogenase (short-subunit alcohol dehydrogenase family)